MTNYPTAKLRVIDPENALAEMTTFGETLVAEGERPWFEVRFPSPDFMSQEERDRWQEHQEEFVDVVELIDGDIIALDEDELDKGTE